MPFQLMKQDEIIATPPKVIIIDDEFTSRVILERIVKNVHGDIEVTTFAEPVSAMTWMSKRTPDLILLDYLMEGLSGLEVITKIRQQPHLVNVPIVMVTVADDKDIRYQALDAGATDFITKPLDPYECRIRCRNLLSLRIHQQCALNRAKTLELAVAQATQQVIDREKETLLRLAKAGEFRDEETGNHVIRMAKYSRLIGEAMGLPPERCELIEIAAPMHDIGKIGIPDSILLKPAPLTQAEFSVMQGHPIIGYRLLHNSPSQFIALAAEISLGHHEKFDGSGYPYRLVGKNIPLESRIVAVADTYDALTSVRPYKKAWTKEHALEYLIAHQGDHFDPECIKAFITQFSKITLIQQQLQDVHTVASMRALP
ncbi:MAG: HD domain-containing phosphohydrolase [Sideroxydans sp.]